MNFHTIIKPMLLKEEEYPFDSKDYLYELKFDGIRALIYVSKDEFHVYSRNKVDLTHLFPELESIKSFINDEVIFDGEIVLFKDKKPSFSELQKRIHLKDLEKIKMSALYSPVCFVAFDILYQNKSYLNIPLIKRKGLLEKYKDTEEFVKTKYIIGEGVKLFQKVKRQGLEGIVAKKKDSVYNKGQRSDDWIKIKNFCDGDFLLGGYVNKKAHNLLVLYLGEYRNDKFYYVGKVIVSSKSSIASMILKQKKRKLNPFIDEFKEKVSFLNPKIVCDVEYLERTKNLHLRHAVLKRLK